MEGKERYTKSQVGYNSAIWGADPVRTISTKIGKFVAVHDVIIHSNFGFNIFRGFRSTGGQIFRFPIDFAGHLYNSADATVQSVIPWMLIPTSDSPTPSVTIILSVEGHTLEKVGLGLLCSKRS